MILTLGHGQSHSALCGQKVRLFAVFVVVMGVAALGAAGRFHIGMIAGSLELVGLDLLDGEDDVLMDLAVHGQFTGLAESSIASWIFAFKGLLLGVDVHVLLQILLERKGLEADYTNVLFDL